MLDRPALFLREWRKHRGYTLERLAEAMEMSLSYVSDVERGRRRYNQSFLEQAALVLRTSPADLLRRRPEDPEAIELSGLTPEDAAVLTSLADRMRRTGTEG